MILNLKSRSGDCENVRMWTVLPVQGLFLDAWDKVLSVCPSSLALTHQVVMSISLHDPENHFLSPGGTKEIRLPLAL